jgi:hypothetical protein
MDASKRRVIRFLQKEIRTYTALAFYVANKKYLTDLEVEDVYNYIGSTIQKNKVSPDEHVCTIGRWRR